VDAFWLISRSGIRPFLSPIEAIPVKRSSRNAFHNSVKIPVSGTLHGNRDLARLDNAHLNASSARRPHEKAACVLAYKNTAKSFTASSHV
jgi:hypothetical protein